MAEIQNTQQAQQLARGMQVAIQNGTATADQIAAAKAALTAFQNRGAQPFDSAAAAAGPVPTGDIQENLTAAAKGAFGDVAGTVLAQNPLAAAVTGIGQGVASVGRGIQQLTSSPQEAAAVANVEQAARAQWEDFDEGLGPEDAGEVAFFMGSLLAPGVNAVQAAATGTRALNVVKSLPKGWAPWAGIAGLSEFVTGKTEEEVRGVEALKAAGLTAAGGVVGNKLGGMLANRFNTTGAGATLAATLGAVAGPRLSRRIFAEGIFRRMSRALTGRQAVSASDPVERALLRRGGQEDARLAREGAKAAGEVAARPGLTDTTISNFLDELPKIVKAIRPTKAAKEAGRTTKDLRTEANTLFDMLQQRSLKTNPDGTSFLDVAELRAGLAEIKKSKNFDTIFSGPKQKQLDELVNSYVKSATTANKNIGDVAAPFQKAQEFVAGERSAGLKEVEEYLAARLGREPDPSFGTAGAVGTWMLANDIDADQIRQAFTEEGWASQLGLFESIAEQVDNESEGSQ